MEATRVDRAPKRMPDEERRGRKGQAEGDPYKGKRGFVKAKGRVSFRKEGGSDPQYKII